MSKIELQPTPTALWHALVNDAELATDLKLDSELESYLVFLLMRFHDRPEMAGKVLAIDFLESQLANGQLREDRLRDVADSCLIYSGLYPQLAERRRVDASYYIDLGRSAYHQLANVTVQSLGQLYHQISHAFVQLLDVLSAIRNLSKNDSASLMHLHDLWAQRGSQQAYQDLYRQMGLEAIPVRNTSKQQH